MLDVKAAVAAGVLVVTLKTEDSFRVVAGVLAELPKSLAMKKEECRFLALLPEDAVMSV
jgi:hypothetical protein